jgi:hypothetical protein
MPTTSPRYDERLIALFLSVYEGGGWAGGKSRKEYPERTEDGAVEVIATQAASGNSLAIEHTLIEPFIGEKTNLHRHFRHFWTALRSDRALYEPDAALYIEAPVDVLPRGSEWEGIIRDVRHWLLATKQQFGIDKELRDCPTVHHPEGKITFRVRRVPLGDSPDGFVIVQRYGDIRVGESVRRAVERKLPKLLRTAVDKRLLMLERDQGFVYPEHIVRELDALSIEFPGIRQVETWIADTASFDESMDYVEFQRYAGDSVTESFAFMKDELFSVGRNGMPVPREWWPT